MEQNFRDLVRDLEKQKEEVRTALEQRERDAVDQVKVIVDALDERAKVLHEDKQTREQLHSISDSVLFLQVTSNSFTTQSLLFPPLPLQVSPQVLPAERPQWYWNGFAGAGRSGCPWPSQNPEAGQFVC